jgi:hypothetical protein
VGFAQGGIKKLSQLTIDVSKDWQAKLINNLGAGVASTDAIQLQQAILQSLLTAQGDVIYRGPSVAARLPGAGSPGVTLDPDTGVSFLHYNLDTQLPEWSDVQQLVGKWFARVRLAIPAIPGIAQSVVENHSGGAFTTTKSQTIPGLPSIAKTVPVPTNDAIGGAFRHIESPLSDTDETAASNSATANDMTLSGGAATPAVTDGYELGYASLFDGVCVQVGTAGVGTYSYTLKYWSGAAWTAFSANSLIWYDQTGDFKATGKKWVAWVRPGDWALKTIGGLNLYYIKYEIISYTSMTTKPLGTRAWINIFT